MKVWIKGSTSQSIYTALAPKSNVLKKGGGTAPAEVVGDAVQTLIVKREASAWKNPFAMVFNPYFEGEENPIEDVKFSSIKENPSTQFIDVKLSDNKVDSIVLNASEEDVVEKDGLYQKGLLSVTRKAKGTNDLDYFFISGMYKYIQNGWEIFTSGEPITLSVERSDNTFIIESDGAVVIRAPFLNGKKSAELRIFENDKLVAKRQGQINRSNPEQLEFRLSKAYSKVLIVY